MSSLRFSVHHDTEAVRIELGGSLTGADVETIYQAWQREAWPEPFKPVIPDTTSSTEADKHGRALLVLIYRFGAGVVAKSAESSAIPLPLLAEPTKAASRVGWFGSPPAACRDSPLQTSGKATGGTLITGPSHVSPGHSREAENDSRLYEYRIKARIVNRRK